MAYSAGLGILPVEEVVGGDGGDVGGGVGVQVILEQLRLGEGK